MPLWLAWADRRLNVTITLHIRPEVQAELARQAEIRGRALEVHAARLLEEAAGLADEGGKATPGNGNGRKGLVEVCAMVSGLTDDIDFGRNPSLGRPVDLS
jgi:hypothetical protein